MSSPDTLILNNKNKKKNLNRAEFILFVVFYDNISIITLRIINCCLDYRLFEIDMCRLKECALIMLALYLRWF